MQAHEMTAAAAAAAIRQEKLTSEQLVRSCLERIAQADRTVHAWAYLSPARALEQALEADRLQRSGAPLGPLHGVPVGIKDIFDTSDMPTENGTVLHAGRQPQEDATVVSLLRKAGAVILGKTVTTELAVYAPGKTTNPHDPRRTPGGSSSGSAAAVAARMVPLAVGTQTNGSVIRPASYCGVHGYKPSFGSISRHGVLKQSASLDQVGVFARSVQDLALIAAPLFVADGKDPDVRPDAGAALRNGPTAPDRPPRIAFVRSPPWSHATEPAKAAFASLTRHWREFVREAELPPLFESAAGWHRTIMESDLANNFGSDYERGKERLSGTLREMIERGQRYSGMEYSQARDGMAALCQALDELFSDCDAILTPATPGAAPLGLASTGSPMFCTIWTLCGVPAMSLPILQAEDGMPMGAQLVGAKGADRHLLEVAQWLAERPTLADAKDRQ
jgi:Asp-tRNA(Asn)/Glu-tRNA(Gln) amidotransferase A subunit family amidase